MITGPVYVSLFYLLPCLFASFFVLLYINSSLVEKKLKPNYKIPRQSESYFKIYRIIIFWKHFVLKA